MIPDNNHPAVLLALFSFFLFSLCPMLCKGAVGFLLAGHGITHLLTGSGNEQRASTKAAPRSVTSYPDEDLDE